jgi:hypothetical protein
MKLARLMAVSDKPWSALNRPNRLQSRPIQALLSCQSNMSVKEAKAFGKLS